MDVYRISSDLKSCQSLSFTHAVELPDFKGVPIKDWKAPSLCIEDPRSPRANFYSFAGELVFDEIAHSVLKSILEKAGEIHSMDVEGAGKLYILNPLVRIDALDEENIERYVDHLGVEFGVKKHAFLTHAFTDSSIFLLSMYSLGPKFSYTGKLDPDEEFIGRYNSHNLTGLEFEHLWSGD